MNSQIKEALVDLAVSCIKGIKIFLTRIVPAGVLAVLLSPQFAEFLSTKPEIVGLVPVISVFITVIVETTKRQFPDNELVQKL